MGGPCKDKDSRILDSCKEDMQRAARKEGTLWQIGMEELSGLPRVLWTDSCRVRRVGALI